MPVSEVYRLLNIIDGKYVSLEDIFSSEKNNSLVLTSCRSGHILEIILTYYSPFKDWPKSAFKEEKITLTDKSTARLQYPHISEDPALGRFYIL